MLDNSIECAGGLAVDTDVQEMESMERFRNFSAVQDVPPQKTLFIHVNGEIYVSNPGIDVELVTAEPQGSNPNILLIQANLIQKPGIWPRVFTWKPARYTSWMVDDGQYGEVQIIAPFGSHTVPVTKRS